MTIGKRKARQYISCYGSRKQDFVYRNISYMVTFGVCYVVQILHQIVIFCIKTIILSVIYIIYSIIFGCCIKLSFSILKYHSTNHFFSGFQTEIHGLQVAVLKVFQLLCHICMHTAYVSLRSN